MKNLFNFKWLLLCIVLSIASVSPAWAEYDYSWFGNVFFRAPDDWDLDTYSHVQIGLARTTDTTTITHVWYFSQMDRVGETRLFYKYVGDNHSSWHQNEYVVFTANTDNWKEGDFKVSKCSCYTTPVNYGFSNDNFPYLFNPTSEENGAEVTGSCVGKDGDGKDYNTRRTELLVKTQRADLYTNGSSSKTGGSVTIAGYYLPTNTTTGSGSGSNEDNTYASYDCVIGSTVTLTATPADGYEFAGWYTASTGGTKESPSATYSYICTGAKTLYACFETKHTLTINAGTGGSTTPESGTVASNIGYYTAQTITATPEVGYYFVNWTTTGNASVDDDDNATTIARLAGGNGTVTANFARKYAYIVGRFHVTNEARNGSWTNTFDYGSSPWWDSSNKIKFDYDATKHVFYRRTYATLDELSEKLGDSPQDPWFFVKTSSTGEGSLTDEHTYQHGSDASFTAAGESNKLLLQENKGSGSVKFNSSDISGYVVIYFDESYIWYEVEPATFIGGQAGHETEWNYAANWSPNVVPTSDLDVLIQAPVVVDINNARAKSVKIYNDGSTKIGKLTIGAGKALIVEEDIKKTTDGSTKILTTADVLKIEAGNTSSTANGALVWGTEGTPGAAQVDFCTKSHGIKNSDASVNQYIGTPFSNDQIILYQYYYSWMYKIKRTDGVLDWELMAEGESMNEFEGYNLITAYESGTTYQMDGTLVSNANVTLNGSSTPKLIYSGSGEEDEPKNENVLANSWVAPIRINTMSGFSNVESSIYIFNAGSVEDAKDGKTLAGTYSCYSTSTALASDVIPSMQSFSVYATGASPSLTLNYNTIVKSPLTSAYNNSINKAPRHSKADEMKLLKVRVQGAKGWADELKIYTHEAFLTEFEDSWDAHKMYGYPQVPQLYAVTTDGNLAIDCVPTADNTVLGFKPGSDDSEYTFSFTYEGDEELYLKDTKTSIETPISSENSYTFTSESSDSDIRFVIRRAPAVVTGMEELNANGNVQKIMHNGALYIVREGKIYSVDGALVK